MNLNIFKRIAALEEEQKQINIILLDAVMAIQQLQKTVNNNTVLKKTADEKKARVRAYAKRYYAKKKAALAFLKAAA